MPQLQLRVECAHPEFAEELLLAAGALSVSLSDSGDDPVLEPAPGTTPLWSRTVATGLFAADADLSTVEDVLRRELSMDASLRIASARLDDQDWVRVWLEHCQPMKFGTRLWVCPEARRVDEPGCATVLLDPGLAFGTGTHPSTALCLDWLATHDVSARSVLDFGCGSGILVIAALKLGAGSGTAFDIDPQAIQATRENALRNGVAERLALVEHDATVDMRPFDLVLANILANPLIELAPQLCNRLAPGGQLVLAGLLQRQADEVREAYQPWIDFAPDAQREGWTRLSGQRRA